ncbi:hypoxanthine-guanine phosphoribosyltransferase [Thioalkalicoccus limnaeus]|uniref:Hypoxanthine-guanine phosphoribosyltransferase n=1 Tax=Thioalkalicoccus limnaeus TaxID=120681 RepID=A0ABV4BCS0_9GAMM
MTLPPDCYRGVAARAECLVTGEEMDRALDRLATEVTAALADQDPLVLCVMTGGIIAAGQLLPRLDFPLRLDYAHATRYLGATSGGILEWRHRPSDAIRGQHLLLVDDILDEGITLHTLIEACREDGAASVRSLVLVEKERERPVSCRADFVGVRLPNRYLYGYGLDYKHYFRNARGIYAVADVDI